MQNKASQLQTSKQYSLLGAYQLKALRQTQVKMVITELDYVDEPLPSNLSLQKSNHTSSSLL